MRRREDGSLVYYVILGFLFFFFFVPRNRERKGSRKMERRRKKKKKKTIPVHIIENLDSLFALIITNSLHVLCLFTRHTEHTLFICTYPHSSCARTYIQKAQCRGHWNYFSYIFRIFVPPATYFLCLNNDNYYHGYVLSTLAIRSPPYILRPSFLFSFNNLFLSFFRTSVPWIQWVKDATVLETQGIY